MYERIRKFRDKQKSDQLLSLTLHLLIKELDKVYNKYFINYTFKHVINNNPFSFNMEIDTNIKYTKLYMENKPTNEQIEKELSEAAENILEKLENMSDEELLKELEECESGFFSQMIEDGFILPGMEEIGDSSSNINEHYEKN